MSNGKITAGWWMVSIPIIIGLLAIFISPGGKPIVPLWIIGGIVVIVGAVLLVMGYAEKRKEK